MISELGDYREQCILSHFVSAWGLFRKKAFLSTIYTLARLAKETEVLKMFIFLNYLF